MTEVQG